MNINGNGTLKLYFYPASFYSQRAVFTLHEKGLSFDHKLVSLYKGEQYSPEYLRLNPNGQVPTLQDGVKIIPDSSAIIEYLEDNFSNGKYPRLLPLDKSSEAYCKIIAFTEDFLKLEIPVLTYGTLHNETLRQSVALPKILVKKMVEGTKGPHMKVLERAIEEVPDARELLQRKKVTMQAFGEAIRDPARHQQAIRGVEAFLEKAENELASHTGDRVNWWLCGPSFSLADIDLCVLLNRICMLGLQKQLFVGCRPHLGTYLRRARQRPAFQKTTTQPLAIRALLLAESVAAFVPLLLGVGAVAAVAYAIYAARREG